MHEDDGESVDEARDTCGEIKYFLIIALLYSFSGPFDV